MTDQFWCETCEQVSASGDHECEPKGVEEFLAWFRAQYGRRGILTWGDLCSAWALNRGGRLPAVYLLKQVDQYLRYLQDITGEVVCDTDPYPPVYYPRGLEAERKTREGLQQALDTAVKMATERGYGKVQI